MRLSELSNFPTPWVSNFQTPSSQTFELEKLSNFRTRAWGLLCEPLLVLQRSFTLLPRATCCHGFKLPSWIPIQTFNLQTRAHFQARNSQTFKLQTLHSPKFSNFQTLQSRPTYGTFKLSTIRVRKTPLVTPLEIFPMVPAFLQSHTTSAACSAVWVLVVV